MLKAELHVLSPCKLLMQVSQELDLFSRFFRIVPIEEALDHMNQVVETEFLVRD